MGILGFRESEVNNHGPSCRAVKEEQNLALVKAKKKKGYARRLLVKSDSLLAPAGFSKQSGSI